MHEILLVGSVPLADAAAVFEATSRLSEHLKRVPDGETGSRSFWIQWQREFLSQVEGIDVRSSKIIQGGLEFPQFGLASGMVPHDVRFQSLGYAEAALRSYSEFDRCRSRGLFRPNTRFQVSLPTPFAVVRSFFVAPEHLAIWPVYERRLFEELEQICAGIPQEDLAIQWDVASEIHSVLEIPDMPGKDAIVDGVVRAANQVPRGVQMGFHFCYGDPGHKHVMEPRDTSVMVALANTLFPSVARRVDWMHMPVPRERHDDGYFAPLERLTFPKETELYLGLIHLTDAIEGTRRRMDTAAKYTERFGVATECGFGRRSPETIDALIELHLATARLP